MYQEPLQIIQKDKFTSFLNSKENENNPSLSFYYTVAAIAVPFLWESQPGRPKSTVAATDLPPLSPPPSFYLLNSKKKTAMSTRFSKNKLLNIMPAKLRKPTLPSWRSSSSSSSLPLLLSDSLHMEGRVERRGCHSVGVIKKMLMEVFTCAKFM